MKMRWFCYIFSAIVFWTLFSPAFGQESTPSQTGVAITRKVPFVEETWAEASYRTVPPATAPVRTISYKRPTKEIRGYFPPRFDSGDRALDPQPQRSVKASELEISFAGLGDTNTANPPDTLGGPPDTMGAVGPAHLVEILETEMAIFDKATGSILSGTQITIDSFWASLLSQTGPFSAYEPKALYDQHSGRFIVTCLGLNFNSPSQTSWILIAVSRSSNPSDGWLKYAIDADKDNGVQTNNFADVIGLGVDARNVYVTANMVDETAGTVDYPKIWIIAKSQLFLREGIITVTELINIYSGQPPNSFDIQPVHVFGSSDVHYVIESNIVITSQPDRRYLRLGRIAFSGTAATFTDLGFVEVNSYSFTLPGAPQLGTTNLIQINNTSLLNAVLRNGRIWTTHNVPSSDSLRSEVAWYEVDPDAASTVTPGGVVQQGRISDSTRFYYYPSIAVNKNSDVAIGFSGSSAEEYVGAYYTVRESTDTAGTMPAVSLLKAGEASYFKISSPSRWGDYSATCIDPTDDFTFWTLQEYAVTPAPTYNRWGTFWGKFAVRPLIVKNGSKGGGCTIVPGTTPASPGGYFLPFLGLALYLLLKRRAAMRPAAN